MSEVKLTLSELNIILNALYCLRKEQQKMLRALDPTGAMVKHGIEMVDGLTQKITAIRDAELDK